MSSKTLTRILIGITLFPLIFFSINFINSDFFVAGDHFLFVGSILGLIGYIFLWWMYILGIRAILVLISKDLFSINDIHQELGIYGFILIFFHPILVWIDSLIKGFSFSFFNLGTEYDRLIAVGTISLVLLFIIWYTSKLARKYYSFRTWKRLHLLSYIILFVIYKHSIDLGIFLSNPLLRTYWDILFIAFVLTVIYKIFFQLGAFRKKYEILSIDYLTHNIIDIKLKPIGKFIKPSPGQFVYMQKGILGESHPYTVSDFNPETSELSLGIKFLGKASESTKNWKSGEVVFLDGPYGVFTKEGYELDDPLVLIAGGIGITPFMRLLNELERDPSKFDQDIHLFFGSQSEEDIAYREEIEKMAKIYPKFKFTYILSEVRSNDPAMEFGFITPEILKKHLGDLNNYKFFICGPTVMVKKLEEAFMEEGLSKEIVYSEKFSL